jgi:uncharacterized membrane protein
MNSISAEPVVAAALDARGYRLTSIDALRGLAIVVMALDHVRDYVMVAAAQDPMADPNIGAALFFTRWITHYCAPTFVFLAGTSAGLMASRRSPAALARFLLTRGLWLIAVELFIVATAWTFAPWGIPQMEGRIVVPMQVIWAIGASMVVLAPVQLLGRRACLAIGGLIVVAHNLLDPIWPQTTLFDTSGPLWAALHSQVGHVVGPFFLGFVYPVLPWIGVMMVGYGAAAIFEQAPDPRRRLLARCGVAAIMAFGLIRASGLYGDPNPWQSQANVVSTAIDFLNVTKYPPSVSFLLMTIGPVSLLCAYADRWPVRMTRWLATFGRVPFAFYVAHLYLIHAIAIALGLMQGFAAGQFLTVMFFFPQGYGVGLFGVYAIWVMVILTLYPLCRWMEGVKARRRDWWLSYV